MEYATGAICHFRVKKKFKLIRKYIKPIITHKQCNICFYLVFLARSLTLLLCYSKFFCSKSLFCFCQHCCYRRGLQRSLCHFSLISFSSSLEPPHQTGIIHSRFSAISLSLLSPLFSPMPPQLRSRSRSRLVFYF